MLLGRKTHSFCNANVVHSQMIDYKVIIGLFLETIFLKNNYKIHQLHSYEGMANQTKNAITDVYKL